MDEQPLDKPADQITTVKIPAIQLTEENEKEYAKARYDEALKAMIADPTDENITKFGNANRFLFEVEDKYRIGARLVIQHKRDQVLLISKSVRMA